MEENKSVPANNVDINTSVREQQCCPGVLQQLSTHQQQHQHHVVQTYTWSIHNATNLTIVLWAFFPKVPIKNDLFIFLVTWHVSKSSYFYNI